MTQGRFSSVQEYYWEEASGVQKASRKQHLKGVASVEASSPSAGIRVSAQYPCSEVTRFHGALMHRGLLRHPPLHLASRGHATCPQPVHLHMVH
jgi:hypothetical protein